MGKLMGDGASNNDMMTTSLAELLDDFNPTDQERCLNHVLHLNTIRIINPFDVKPWHLDHALADAARKHEAISNDLTSLGDMDKEDEAREG